MAKTVVGLFDTFMEAQAVVQELMDAGFERDKISLVANDAKGEYAKFKSDVGESKAAEGAGTGAVAGGIGGGALGLLVGIGALAIPGIGPVLAAGPLVSALGAAGAATLTGAGIGAATGGLLGGLVGAGIPEEDANYYSEGVRRGGTLVMVNAADTMADGAYDIMQRHGAVDIDERGTQWRASGWNRFDANAKPYTTSEIDKFRTTGPSTATASGKNVTDRNLREGKTVMPVVEEEAQINKRQVERGGVRIYTHMSERPVEEQVQLREERVNVERRPVDRPASEADIASFKEGTIEVRETSEEAVVDKRARVVEEVIIDKDVQERTETVRDTVRRTDVDVEPISGERAVGDTGFDAFDSDFRSNYQSNFASSGYTYDQFAPVYRYGYNLGTNKRYSSRDWSNVETDARRQWEERNPGTWEQFKDAIRYSWDKARGRR